MKLTMLGTGNAVATECYNTCFVFDDEKKYFMVDGGGGNTVLSQLKKAGYKWQDMHEIFVTHKHIDHLLGIIWMVRMICQSMSHGKYIGEANIYAHDEVTALIESMSKSLLREKDARFIGDRLHLITVADGETRLINGRRVTFFDIHSTKAKQYGFCMELNDGKKLVCCGDEPCTEGEYQYAENADWLLHEAFCLNSQADIFHPYEKHHSTVKDACELAEKLGVKNLLLYHTEDKNIKNRRQLYVEEGRKYYHGNLFVPDDLDTIEI
jgi:ribonuclease Z